MKITQFVSLCIFLISCALSTPAGEPLYKNPKAPVADRVTDLLSRMTLEEKLAQMTIRSSTRMLDEGRLPMKDGHLDTSKMEAVLQGKCYGLLEGSFGGDIRIMPVILNAAQRYCLEKTRLGIPMIPYIETLHGVMFYGGTIYPQAVAIASTWNLPLVRKAATEIADEASSVGIRQALAPPADLIRDQRWGRVEEAYGEDPYLVSRMVVTYVEGLQGKAEQTRTGIGQHHLAAMCKGYIGHGFPERGINLAPILVPEIELRNFFLPPYAAAIREANVYSVMPVYDEVNGVPAHASVKLLKELLRKELGFEGYIFSDYGGVQMIHGFHHMATSRAEAGAMAVRAGVDVEAPSDTCYRFLPELIQTGKVPMELIDASVRRVLTAKFKLGLFEHPYVDPKEFEKHVRAPEHIQTARQVAEESITLLQNRGGVLPLDRKRIKSIAVIGPNAAQVQFGDYSPTKDNRNGVTILQGIKALAEPGWQVRYAKGCSLLGKDRSGFDDAVAAARASDVAVVVVGETSMPLQGVGWLKEPEDYRHATSGEGYDRTDLGLTGVQEDLIKAVAGAGKPVVVVLVNGRPQAIPWVKEHIPAILEAWYPGEQGGHAVASILFGRVNPSGRLPITFPSTVGQLPVYYNHKPSAMGYYHKPGSPDHPGRDYVDASPAPLFPFGHGLSYTSFEYSGLRLSSEKIRPDENLEVRCRVKNTGNRPGKEVVQLYLRTNSTVITMPVLELKKFTKIKLAAGEEKEVSFTLTPSDLAHLTPTFESIVEECGYEVMVGASSADIRLRQKFEVAGK